MFRHTFVVNDQFELSFLLHCHWQMKRWSELSRTMKIYFCFSVVSLLVLVSITSYSINKQHKSTYINHEDNFTVSLIQLFGLREYEVGGACRDTFGQPKLYIPPLR